MVKTSVKLCLILRHKPELINAKLDSEGFIDVEFLINGFNKIHDKKIDKDILEKIVREDDKGRYSYNEDHTRIRCNQGHNKKVNVDITFNKKYPPKTLYHGTASSSLDSIMRDGIKSMSRQYIHLSDNIKTASKVGSRHGELTILHIDTEAMIKDGLEFFVSDNGVWLFNGIIEPRYFFVETTKSHITTKISGDNLYGVATVIPKFSTEPIMVAGMINMYTNEFTDFGVINTKFIHSIHLTDLLICDKELKNKYAENMKRDYSWFSTHAYLVEDDINKAISLKSTGLNMEINDILCRSDLAVHVNRVAAIVISVKLQEAMEELLIFRNDKLISKTKTNS